MWRILCLAVLGLLAPLCVSLHAVASETDRTDEKLGSTGMTGVNIVTESLAGTPTRVAPVPTGSASVDLVPADAAPAGAAPIGVAPIGAAPAVLAPDKVINKNGQNIRVEVHYPELGVPAIDNDIHAWAEQISDNFLNEFQGETAEARAPYDLGTTYSLLRPTANTAVTVVWEVASYTQGAHGNLDIVTYSYTLPDGAPLTLGELFTDLGTALNLMSEAAYSRLSHTLGEMLSEDMLRSGTTPDPDNFSSFALVPGALRVFFQPYQVAPWAAGPQSVDIPLEELEDADPQYKYWGGKKKEEDVPL